MPSVEHIRGRLAAYEPRLEDPLGRRQAAVAMVLREDRGPAEVLFIERAAREGDPWSGHMAFPGGRLDPEDASSRGAAERETLEEVGVSLEGAPYLGRLDDLTGRPSAPDGGMVVSAHVYHLATPPRELAINHEVAEAFWFPLRGLLEDERHVTYPHATYGGHKLPGILVGHPERHIVWGLTYRFLNVFFDAVGNPLPDRWDRLRREQ